MKASLRHPALQASLDAAPFIRQLYDMSRDQG
jgi:hypothetical protein